MLPEVHKHSSRVHTDRWGVGSPLPLRSRETWQTTRQEDSSSLAQSARVSPSVQAHLAQLVGRRPLCGMWHNTARGGHAATIPCACSHGSHKLRLPTDKTFVPRTSCPSLCTVTLSTCQGASVTRVYGSPVHLPACALRCSPGYRRCSGPNFPSIQPGARYKQHRSGPRQVSKYLATGTG